MEKLITGGTKFIAVNPRKRWSSKDMKDITHKNISVIGCGYWGKNLVRNFGDLGALRSICDSNGETLKQLGVTYPSVKRETNFSDVLSDNKIEGVVISTPAAAVGMRTRPVPQPSSSVQTPVFRE